MVCSAIQIAQLETDRCQTVVDIRRVRPESQGLQINLPCAVPVPLLHALAGTLQQSFHTFGCHGSGPHSGSREDPLPNNPRNIIDCPASLPQRQLRASSAWGQVSDLPAGRASWKLAPTSRETVYTVSGKANGLRYLRPSNWLASASSRMVSAVASNCSVRPVRYAMLPRWQSRVLLWPSSMSAFGRLPERMQSRKLRKCGRSASPSLSDPSTPPRTCQPLPSKTSVPFSPCKLTPHDRRSASFLAQMRCSHT